jgi:hypothetical protein
VPVDVFWAYGIGAGMAVAASRQLRARQAFAKGEEVPPATPEGVRVKHLWQTPYFVGTLLFLALLFAPSGIYLLWEFPSWETMHAGDRSLPGWLVVTFAITNVTQGLLGFWIVDRLLAHGRTYLAYLQPVIAYFGMFFILVHGWDGQGYQRFFSETAADFRAWDGDWTDWLGSDVALTLYAMGAILIPVLCVLVGRWQVEGYRIGGRFAPSRRAPSAAGAVALMLTSVFAIALPTAIGASLLIHWLGPLAGGLAAAALAWLLVLRPGAPAWQLFRRSALEDAAAAGQREPEPKRSSAATDTATPAAP